MCKRAPALGFHYKLFQGTHVPDIVMTSAETSNVKAHSKKADVIAVLKETCRELDARKGTLEELITSLEQEENEEQMREEDADEEQHDGSARSSPEDAAENSASSGDDST